MGHRGEKVSDRPYRKSDKRRAERLWRGEVVEECRDRWVCLGCSRCDAEWANA